MDEVRSVFRPEAIRRYQDSREKTVIPLFGAPRARGAVWISVSLLFVALCVAAFTEVPVYVRGQAFPVGTPDAQGRVSSIVLFPPESLPQLKVGQRVFIVLSEGGGITSGTVTNLMPGLLSPGEISALTTPVVVAFAHFTWILAPDSFQPGNGSRAVWVEVGSRRLGSLIKFN